MKERHYVNLSNGILAVKEFKLKDPVFIRIQSTACEQNLMSQIIDTISDDLLMHLALGDTLCHIYDYSSRGSSPLPRALWQGLEWIKYVIYRIWWDKEYIPLNRHSNTPDRSQLRYFNKEFCKLSKTTRKHIKYYKKWINFLKPKNLHIQTHANKTKLDGKYELMRDEYLSTLKGL